MAIAYTAAGLPLPGARRLCRDHCFKARFWGKVSRKDAGRDDCWLWRGAREEKGYGRFRVSNTPSLTCQSHRVAWMLANRRWPRSDRMVLHACDNPRCVNPRHLREGTAQENQDDIEARGRRRCARLRGHIAGRDHWRGSQAPEGTLRGGSTLSPWRVQELRRAVAAAGGPVRARRSGETLLLALDHGVTEQVIYDASRRKTFRWVVGDGGGRI